VTSRRHQGGINTVGDGHRALYEVVTEQVRAAILNGDLFPGERLVEDRLAQELQVSRHPVREALRTLQLEGLVEISPRRGATVSRITPEEAGEFFQVLAVLDGLAARLASMHRDSDDIGALESVLERAGEAQGNEDLPTLTQLNREFHSIVAAAGLPAGHRLRRDDLAFKKPGTGIPAAQWERLVGRVVKHDLNADHFFAEDDLD